MDARPLHHPDHLHNLNYAPLGIIYVMIYHILKQLLTTAPHSSSLIHYIDPDTAYLYVNNLQLYVNNLLIITDIRSSLQSIQSHILLE